MKKRRPPATGWTWCHEALVRSAASDGAVRLFLWLTLHHGDKGCIPGQALLAQEMKCSEKSVRRYSDELRRLGFIDWRRHWIATKHGAIQRSEYFFCDVPPLTGHECPLSDRTQASNHPERLDTGVHSHSERVDKIDPSDWTKSTRVTGQKRPPNLNSGTQTFELRESASSERIVPLRLRARGTGAEGSLPRTAKLQNPEPDPFEEAMRQIEAEEAAQ